MIFHVVPLSDWNAAGTAPYAPSSLASEGFVHCSGDRATALAIADAHYGDESAPLLVLSIDEAALGAEVRWEGRDGAFPHVYGPIERAAVTGVVQLHRAAGKWTTP
ncbi:DUF952 domain-containing protein [Streptomyces sp. CBMA152]|uniref:DUF952 domain-containing protein n=1 Tax=Streptomyces sp. CBMA152 TaxID=1896312 RepID=UPI001660E910|nr:DUF952 domain-containing protein [Streptomyces sp. CBMA152]MBD0744379.1 hypothetical protein [Streptomyces sp. CBMA152]